MKKQRKFLYSVVVGMFLAVSLSMAPAKAEAGWWGDLWDHCVGLVLPGQLAFCRDEVVRRRLGT